MNKNQTKSILDEAIEEASTKEVKQLTASPEILPTADDSILSTGSAQYEVQTSQDCKVVDYRFYDYIIGVITDNSDHFMGVKYIKVLYHATSGRQLRDISTEEILEKYFKDSER